MRDAERARVRSHHGGRARRVHARARPRGQSSVPGALMRGSDDDDVLFWRRARARVRACVCVVTVLCLHHHTYNVPQQNRQTEVLPRRVKHLYFFFFCVGGVRVTLCMHVYYLI